MKGYMHIPVIDGKVLDCLMNVRRMQLGYIQRAQPQRAAEIKAPRIEYPWTDPKPSLCSALADPCKWILTRLTLFKL